jgi:phosphate-selective porin OprO/OprP
MRTVPWRIAVTLVAIAPAAARAQEKPAETKLPPFSAGAEGFVIQSESGDYRLQVRGYAHFDGRFYPGDEAQAGTDAFLLRRVRPILAGTLAEHFEFNVTADFGGGSASVQDAYLEFRPSNGFRVRVGKFKAPVSLERLQSATWISFVERALPSVLVPNRDVGVQLHGELAGGVVAYAAGVFDGAADGGSLDTDASDDKDLAGRVFLSPFKRGSSAFRNLGFGVAATTGTQTGTLPAYRTGGQLTAFGYVTDATADGTRTRVSPQLSLYAGPFGLLAEHARSATRVRSASAAAKLTHEAWQATATWTLTGEAASYGGVRPKAPFDRARGQWGALELVARVNGIAFDADAFGAFADPARSVRKAFAWGVGLNWYLNRNVKQGVSYERTTFTGGAAAGADRPGENALFIRSQVSF